MNEWGIGAGGQLFGARTSQEKFEVIELVGPHLRVMGTVSLLRFNRLSDLINHARGYLKLTNAQLLRRNGEPTGLFVPELMINQAEVTFVAQKEDNSAPSTELIGGGSAASSMDRPLMERVPRQLVLFTPGHTITGSVHMFQETEIDAFVESTDPLFVPVVDATARSLADRRVISHFALALVNRTQITAASLLERSGDAAESGVSVE